MGIHGTPQDSTGVPWDSTRDPKGFREITREPKILHICRYPCKKIHKVMYSIRFGDIHTIYTKTAF